MTYNFINFTAFISTIFTGSCNSYAVNVLFIVLCPENKFVSYVHLCYNILRYALTDIVRAHHN